MGFFDKLFNRDTNQDKQSKEVQVFFPEEVFSVMKFTKDGLRGTGLITSSLKEFRHREVFGYHLSLILYYDDLAEDGMPSEKEREETDPFCDYLEELLKGDNPNKPNGLFLGRFTWNKTRELIWKIHDPEIADKELKRIIETKDHPRTFEYDMLPDANWGLSKQYLGE